VTRATIAVVAAVVATTLGAPSAAADPKAEAVVLFDQGIKDMKAGRLDKACPELEASLKLVKDSGTKGALARCHGLAGRIASSWLLWRELSDTAPTSELRADAAAHAVKLEPRLPRYAIKLAGATPGLTVRVNGRPVAIQVPVAVPVDPGPIIVVAQGRDGERAITQSWRGDYTAVEGETLTIEVPALEPLVASEPAPAPAPPVVDADRAGRRHRRHIIALVIGGGAVGAAVGGALFGLDAQSKYDDARRICGGAIARCAPEQVAAAQRRVDASRTAALASNVLFGASGALAIAATLVWLSAPSLESRAIAVAPSAGRGQLGVSITGAF